MCFTGNNAVVSERVCGRGTAVDAKVGRSSLETSIRFF
jgi:hypothetical protein